MKILNRIGNKEDDGDEDARSYIEELKRLNTVLSEKDSQIYSVQEDYKKIFNLFSDMVVLLDDNGYVIDLNAKAQTMLKKYQGNGSLIGSNGKDIIEKFGCEGGKSIEKKAIRDDVVHELTKEVYIAGMDCHCLISVIPVKKPESQNYFIVVLKDITVIKNRELSLIKKQKLIGYTASITDMFSRNLNINYILDRVVEILSDIETVDVVYIYKNCDDLDNQAQKIREYYKPKIEASLSERIDYKDFPRGIEYFSLNHIVCGHINDFPKNERYFLRKINIKSICIVPIYTPIGFGGFMGFDSHQQEKQGTYDEEQLLKIAANIIGGELYKGSLRNINSSDIEDIKTKCVNL